MARVKRGVIARKRHKKVLKAAKGYYGARSRVFRVAKQLLPKQVSTLTVTVVSVSVSPRSVDCPYQRRCAYERSVLQPFHCWPEKSCNRNRP